MPFTRGASMKTRLGCEAQVAQVLVEGLKPDSERVGTTAVPNIILTLVTALQVNFSQTELAADLRGRREEISPVAVLAAQGLVLLLVVADLPDHALCGTSGCRSK